MRFTIDCFKTHQTEATTLELYGDHFNESPNMQADGEVVNKNNQNSKKFKHKSASKRLKLGSFNEEVKIPHHIAQNSSSDEVFL